jgi:hypothetical protein
MDRIEKYNRYKLFMEARELIDKLVALELELYGEVNTNLSKYSRDIGNEFYDLMVEREEMCD